jgi:hypothetical protein
MLGVEPASPLGVIESPPPEEGEAEPEAAAADAPIAEEQAA